VISDDLPLIFAGLEASPILLRNLIASVAPDRLKQRRIRGKWSIHEHACHLASIHPLMMQRLDLFQAQESPEIRPFLPGDTDPDDHLIHDDLDQALDRFAADRRAFVTLGRSLSPEVLRRRARHPEYEIYTPYHMLRHILMHDHLHFYRIEELALTTDAYLPQS
jgi:uncharacterized damage-inducible protein DinB